MREYRMSKGTTEHYTDLASLRAAWGKEPVTKKTKDVVKLKKQQEDFMSKHRCKACGAPMTYTGGNIMTCLDPKCKGIEVKHEDKEGNVTVSYITSYDLLDDLGAEIANNIFN
jgi:hypothetical protein